MLRSGEGIALTIWEDSEDRVKYAAVAFVRNVLLVPPYMLPANAGATFDSRA